MKRTYVLGGAIIGVVVLVGFILSGGNGLSISSSTQQIPSATLEDAPNFIIILTDDQDPTTLDYMQTLQEELINQGGLFTNHYVVTPLCCPSRVSILKGQYVHNHLILANAPPDGGFEKVFATGIESQTIATLLDDAGYQTALVGKYLNGYPLREDPVYIPPGWDEWYAVHFEYGADSVYFNYTINENGTSVDYTPDEEIYQTDRISEIANEFIKQNTGVAPFFLYLAPFAPHGPFHPAPRHEGKFADVIAPRLPSFNEEDVSDKPTIVRSNPVLSPDDIEEVDARYRAQVETSQAIDEMIGSILKTLEETDQLENTYIFYTIDNGNFFGIHRFDCCKGSAYEPIVHLPLIVRGPDVSVNSKLDVLAASVDIAPTLLDLAGIPVPDDFDGRSLWPVWAARGNQSDVENWRTHFIISNKCPTPDTVDTFSNCYNAIRSSQYIYVHYPATDEKELYNLIEDPYQLDNLAVVAPSMAEPIMQEHHDAMLKLLQCKGESCRMMENEPIGLP